MSTTKEISIHKNFDLKNLQDSFASFKISCEEIFEIVIFNFKNNNKNYDLKSLLRFLINDFANKCALEKLYTLLEIMINYDFTDYEFNNGLNLLMFHNKLLEILNLFEKIISLKLKIYNIQTLFEVVNKCFLNKTYFSRIYDIFMLLNLKGYEISLSYWRITVEGFMSNTKYEYVEELLHLYPYKVLILFLI
jgi:hypothetical protein